ncbi:orotate phosphoribosyltransferase [Coxiella-like endosymbiont]|uniref:orotate phosphoribosyltransferase n=1 Tax=Coxiella-like endosymbiont TaxID=1592897 RepID=UPI00359CA4D4
MNQAMEIEIAKLLLDIKAVTLNLKEPYRYASGLLSPIYCDNRLIISYPDKRKIVIDAFLHLIEKNKLQFDVVAGTATAGIPHAAWIADRLNLPMVYVRDKAKVHGKKIRLRVVCKRAKKH